MHVPPPHVPTGAYDSDVVGELHVAAGAVLHTMVVPAHAPTALQRSWLVHASPSSHEAFCGFNG